MAVALKVNGLNKIMTLAERYPAISQKHIDKAIGVSINLIWATSVSKSPIGATGNLRRGWVKEFTPFYGRLSNTTSYASDVEYGTPPHYVSPAELEPWVKKKGLPPWLAKVISRSIEKKGTKANPFFSDSIDYVSDAVDNEFTKALSEITSELSK